MRVELGHVSDIFRYPVKSMAGERLDAATLGWHGIEGDRRLAFRPLADRGPFPWLSASRLPALLLYRPGPAAAGPGEPLPTRVRTPDGREYAITDDALPAEIGARLGAGVELLHLRHGVFDEAAVSVITAGTVRGIAAEAGVAPDARRFRPNLLIDTPGGRPFEEDGWVEKTLEFGPPGVGPAVRVTLRDLRCAMVNLDPDTAAANPDVMKAVARGNGNFAGVYGALIRTGEVRVGQPVGLTA